MANKRSKVTSHQKQTNNASEKPLDSIETLIAMPRSEFSENQLARNSITLKTKKTIFREMQCDTKPRKIATTQSRLSCFTNSCLLNANGSKMEMGCLSCAFHET